MYNTEGIILKRTDIGEADSLFTIYTQDFGKIRARAQGIKKEGAKLKGHLEPLSLASISFVLGKNGERLIHASLLDYWPGIRGNLDKLDLAWRIADFVDRHCFPGQKDEALWDTIFDGFRSLADSRGDLNSVDFLGSFGKRISTSLGYGGESDIMRSSKNYLS